MILLGLLIGVAGFAASLLPPLPTGMPYWAVCMVLSVLYPLLLAGKFKSDRADYEFRVLHWFPAGIFALWMVLQLLDGKLPLFHILNLGFLFLWSLPLVALGIAFLIIFALHVIRRSTLRITLLSIFLVLFIVGAVFSESQGFNRTLQRNIFPADLSIMASVGRIFGSAKNYVASIFTTDSGTGVVAVNDRSSSSSKSTSVAVTTSTSSRATVSSSRTSSIATTSSRSSSSAVTSSAATSSRASSVIAMASSSMSSTSSSSSRSTVAVVTSSRSSSVSSSKPTKLPASGPEAAGVLAATLMALYAATVHRKTKERGVA